MNDNIQKAFDFFSPGNNNFWRWADGGEIIEWNSGETIVYRRELRELLNLFKGKGLPPTEAALMILDACKDNWDAEHFVSKLNKLAGFEDIPAPIWMPDDVVAKLPALKKQQFLAIRTLIEVSRLPKEIRSNDYRTLILLNIFEYAPDFLTPAIDANRHLYIFGGDIFTKWINSQPTPHLHNRIAQSFEALSLFPDSVELEDLLRTGLEQAPEPAPLPLPEPGPSKDDLLTQLSQDPQTAGLARLTKRLIAALNIPPHTQGASDQPLGGVSDISNRGDFDRLLLSELANDDDTLSARLVNNEALYLRRETPPDPKVQERVILVDTSLRLWGMPRVFAVSAALGCALNNHQKAGISAFALGKEIIGPNALATKEEVIHFLEQQSPVLHSGEALRAFFRQQPRSVQRAVFFITSEEVMSDKNFSLIFAEQQQHLDYLLVLSRTGTLLFYKLVNGQRSLMSTSVFDLVELLFDSKKSAMLTALVGALGLQAEHAIKHHGLFLPSYPGKLKRDDVAFDGEVLVAVLPSKRVWFWHSVQKGAIEVLDKIEEGGYSFYLVNHELKCIVVTTKERKFMAYLFENNELSAVVDLYAKLIRYYPQQNVVNLHELDEPVVACGYEEGNIFIGLNLPANPNYYYSYKNITHVIDLKDQTISPLPEKRVIAKKYLLPNLHPVKKLVNNGYSVLRNITEIGFTPEGFIQLGRHQIILRDGKLWLTNATFDGLETRSFRFDANLDSQFYTKSCTWPNGSKVVLDSRGYLLFFRPKSLVVNFTITLIIGQELAACTNTGYYAGNPYFFNAQVNQVTTPTDFYKRFIVPFINALDKP